MSEEGGKALVIHLDRNIRKFALQGREKRFDIRHAFGVAVIHLFRMTDNEKVDFFPGNILLKKRHEFMCSNRLQAGSDDPLRIGNGDSYPFSPVVNS